MTAVSPRPAGEPDPRRGASAHPRRTGSVRLRIVKPRRRWRGVRIRITTPTVRIRVAKPRWVAGRSGISAKRRNVAILLDRSGLRLAVSAPGVAASSWHRLSVRLPEDSVIPSVGTSNIRTPQAVAFAMHGLWRQTRLGKRKVNGVSLIIPDQSVRMVAVPLDGGAPGSAEGAEMARWALRHLLPGDGSGFRVDWATLTESGDAAAHRWLFATAAAVDIVREYEAVVEKAGLSAGRVVPLSLAVAVGSEPSVDGGPDAGRLVLCENGAVPAGLIESGGIPRFHRAWRAYPADLTADLRSIDAYARRRLGIRIVEVLIAGPRGWCIQVAEACSPLEWQASSVSLWTAHRGAMV